MCRWGEASSMTVVEFEKFVLWYRDWVKHLPLIASESEIGWYKLTTKERRNVRTTARGNEQ